ncbi:ATP-dependent (S)-NAD(P)H-hydrate dehydratase-like [Helicoverpa zea]|uniref:ATP-dependent (S)-NAD(P)H-hydrate dehydratase-like n=1 Tax=Helicoverpa zea TaxID=7113 RepID=UPI001F59B863|nr:ATP-dependent (S)-NAD(P)H-hydrate dehydratase-like [Helicoverpa zea]
MFSLHSKMRGYSYFVAILCIIVLVNCDEIEDKCNFLDSKLQPNTFRLLSKSIIPTMAGSVKGDAGKIGVIGGSIEYTGAPYFSAITSMKVGADLAYVITTESAATVIKNYSPDLIVYPYLNTKYASKIRSLIPKMDVIVIGPGLGREPETVHLITDIIQDCKNLGKPLVIDADGLYVVSKNTSVIKNYPCPGVVLTPNLREANRLMDAVSKNDSNWYSYWGDCVAVLVKGEKDHFNTNMTVYSWIATGGGSGRRVGGQGDILSGALATFYHWALKTELCKNESQAQLAQSVAAYAAAKITRLCNYKASLEYGQSTLASDMITKIHLALQSAFT